MIREFRQRNIDHYVVLAPLGEGAMGTVYRATDTRLQREVALKVLLPGPYLSEDALARFVNEAQITARVSEHPNLVSIYNAGRSPDGEVYLAMELIQGGETLKSWISDGRTRSDPRRAVELLAQVCDGLQYVHDLGVVHRDLKPENILISADGRAVLGDFGVAKAEGQQGSHTLTGTFVGTLAYASPEQATDSKTVTFKSDLYGIGAVLYAVLTGRAPHVGTNAIGVMLSIIERDPPRPQELNPDVSAALEAVCIRALSRDPEARYGSANELAAALRKAAATCTPAGSPTAAPPPTSNTQTTRAKAPSARLKRPTSGRSARTTSRRLRQQSSGSSAPILVLAAGAVAVVAAVALSGRREVPSADLAGDETPRPTATALPRPDDTPRKTLPVAKTAKTEVTGQTPAVSASPAPSPSPSPTDTTKPTITIRAPTERVVRGPSVVIDLAFDELVVKVLADGKPLPLGRVGGVGSIRTRLDLRRPGLQTVRLEAIDAAGNVGAQELTLVVDQNPPLFAVKVTLGEGDQIQVKGEVRDETRVTVTWGGKPVTKKGGAFALESNVGALRRGRTLVATDAVGRTSEVRVTSKPRLIQMRQDWIAGSEAERQGELLWIGALLGRGFVVRGMVRPVGKPYGIGVVEHRKTKVQLLVIPGGVGYVGLKRGPALKRDLEHALSFPELAKLGAAKIRTHLKMETPQRRHRLRPFLLGRFEVREREWDRVKVAPSLEPKERRGPKLPRGRVSWAAAQAWVEAAGDGLRLPNEIEWEYAYRAGTSTRYFWGGERKPGYCVGGVERREALPRAAEDPPRRTNGFGLVDMAGNCWEWCADDFVEGNDLRQKDPHAVRVLTPRSTFRVARGGSAQHSLPFLRATYRASLPLTDAAPVNGLRVARDLDLSERGRRRTRAR